MPLLSFCSYPGCSCTVPYGTRFCARHQAAGAERDKKSRQEREHPLCAECQRQGRLTPATDADHITPHKGDATLFWDRDNLQALCHACHSRKTASEDGGFNNPRR